MSSLRSSKRKLNAKNVWIAQEVQRKKLEVAKKFVEEKVKTDPEFAKDVLTSVGENLPPDIKKAAEETIAKEECAKEEFLKSKAAQDICDMERRIEDES